MGTADRLAKNDGTPFNPDKESFGQGLVQGTNRNMRNSLFLSNSM